MLKAEVYVNLKPSVLDPQGKVVTNTLHNLGYNNITEVRISKFIEIKLNSDNIKDAERELEEICDKILANPNTEIYKFSIKKAE